MDYVSDESSARVVVDPMDAGGNGGLAAGDTLISIENVFGDLGDDRLFGCDGANALRGEAGDDVLRGRNGDDRLMGGAGDDELKGGWGADVLNGGDGKDKVLFLSDKSGAAIDMAAPGASTGPAAGDTYIDVEIIVASKLDDILRGNDGGQPAQGGQWR